MRPLTRAEYFYHPLTCDRCGSAVEIDLQFEGQTLPPSVPGKTEFEKFDNAMRQVLMVSKEELLKREQAEKNQHLAVTKPKKV